MNIKTPTQSQLKQQQILNAAITLFCHQGFPHTSMDEVAKLAEVSKQTVYAHFGNKDELFIAAIESQCVVHQLGDTLLQDIEDPQACLLKFAQHFSDLIISDPAITVFKACVAQSETHPQVSQMYFAAGPEHVLGLLEEYFTKLNQTDKYNFDDPHQCAVRLCLMLFGELRLKLELGLEVDSLLASRDDYIAQTVAMFIRAYRI